MAGFSTLRALVDASNGGAQKLSTWRKSPSQTTTSGVWTDLSMSPGNPIPNYYASTPLVAATLNGNEGIFHGGAVTPSTKHLKELMVLSNSATGLPLELILCDYLIYYPFVDMGTTDAQSFDNSVTIPRYATGTGVQIIAVEVASQIGGQSFFVSYTNQDGTSGRTSQTVTCNTITSAGTLIQSASATAGSNGPFLPLQIGDSGVRSIQSLTMLGADVGLIALVLVKPLAKLSLVGVNAPVEVDFLRDTPSLPRIYDGAYLNFICHPTGNLSGTALHGTATFTWN